MTFSVDTNIVIGVINPKDNLHKRAASLVNAESKKRPLVPLITVITETKSTFGRKYNKAAGLIFAAINKARRETVRDDDYAKKTVDAMDHLVKTNPDIDGFIKLIYYEQIKENLPQKDMETAFKKVSAKGREYMADVEAALRREANNNTEYAAAADKRYLDTQKEAQNIIKGIYYKDETDRLIFLEAVTYAHVTDRALEHYTNDNECINQSELSLKKIKAEKKYANNKLRVKKLP